EWKFGGVPQDIRSGAHCTMDRKTISIAFVFLLAAVSLLPAQTFEVNQPASSSSSKKKGKKPAAAQQPPAEENGNGIGWGSGIEVARESRAVQQALAKNDYRAAITSASRAAKAAPQNADLWFLLGYAARLGGD